MYVDRYFSRLRVWIAPMFVSKRRIASTLSAAEVALGRAGTAGTQAHTLSDAARKSDRLDFMARWDEVPPIITTKSQSRERGYSPITSVRIPRPRFSSAGVMTSGGSR